MPISYCNCSRGAAEGPIKFIKRGGAEETRRYMGRQIAENCLFLILTLNTLGTWAPWGLWDQVLEFQRGHMCVVCVGVF